MPKPRRLKCACIDSRLCAAHSEKTCYQSCPWGLYPLALKNSSQCGLCMECLRVCPQDNIALNLRPFGSDLGQERSSVQAGRSFPGADDARIRAGFFSGLHRTLG